MPNPVVLDPRPRKQPKPPRGTRTAEQLKRHIPKDRDPQEYLYHLTRQHGLKCSRGEGAVPLYTSGDVEVARADCDATCGQNRLTAHQQSLAARAAAKKNLGKKRAKKPGPASTRDATPDPDEVPVSREDIEELAEYLS